MLDLNSQMFTEETVKSLGTNLETNRKEQKKLKMVLDLIDFMNSHVQEDDYVKLSKKIFSFRLKQLEEEEVFLNSVINEQKGGKLNENIN